MSGVLRNGGNQIPIGWTIVLQPISLEGVS